MTAAATRATAHQAGSSTGGGGKKKVVTPTGTAAGKGNPGTNGGLTAGYAPLDKRMTVDKNVVDELLLVCGVIGTETESTDAAAGQKCIVPVTDCLNWLQDLQRALRRDDDLYRPISTLLGDWKVVQKKLLPLVLSCRYDTSMVLTVCKILVILTKPLAENTIRAGRMVVDTKNTPELYVLVFARAALNCVPGHAIHISLPFRLSLPTTPPRCSVMYVCVCMRSVVKEQIRLRENALKQAETLMEYKRAICRHSSHLATSAQQLRKKKGNSGGGDGILSIFVSLLAEPLSRTGTARTETDHLTIELVLHLFRNLLSAEPILHSSAESAYRATQLHNELIAILERELVLEILLVLGADLVSAADSSMSSINGML